jgi:AcrR family transcriptional regulator
MTATRIADDLVMNEEAAPPGRVGANGRGASLPRGEQTRRRILDVAWRLFAERGYRGTSFNEIAKASNLTMAGLIHHFPSKLDLFSTVLRLREVDEEIRFYGMFGPEPLLFEVLDAFVAMARINARRYTYVQLTHLVAVESAPGDHPATEFTHEHFRRTHVLLRESVRRSIDVGEIASGADPSRIALEVVAMIEGLENQWLHDPEAIDLAGTFTSWIAALKGQLRP